MEEKCLDSSFRLVSYRLDPIFSIKEKNKVIGIIRSILRFLYSIEYLRTNFGKRMCYILRCISFILKRHIWCVNSHVVVLLGYFYHRDTELVWLAVVWSLTKLQALVYKKPKVESEHNHNTACHLSPPSIRSAVFALLFLFFLSPSCEWIWGFVHDQRLSQRQWT